MVELSSQHLRPMDILYEESILGLTDAEYTSIDSFHGSSKRRKV